MESTCIENYRKEEYTEYTIYGYGSPVLPSSMITLYNNHNEILHISSYIMYLHITAS